MTVPVAVTAYTGATAAGLGLAQLRDALLDHRSGLVPFDDAAAGLQTYIGRVDDVAAVTLPLALRGYDCRNNRLAELALSLDGFADGVAAAVARYGTSRVGVVMGTSTSGIAAAEEAYLRLNETGALPADFDFRRSHELCSLACFVSSRLGARGPAYSVSTACTSGAKTFIDGAQLIAADICDAVVVGGVDSLCGTSLHGFHSLQLLSPEPCRPSDAARKGMCIGEAGCFALLERPDAARDGANLMTGYGESADAHHISAPHPEGVGAALAMRRALLRAGLDPADIDYVNMHGTGSAANDRMEHKAMAAVFGPEVECSSTKSWTGHTLGAAGATEAVISLLCLTDGFVPGNINLRRPDEAAVCRLPEKSYRRPLRHVLSSNFGFGGNNCCLIFSKAKR